MLFIRNNAAVPLFLSRVTTVQVYSDLRLGKHKRCPFR